MAYFSNVLIREKSVVDSIARAKKEMFKSRTRINNHQQWKTDKTKALGKPLSATIQKSHRNIPVTTDCDVHETLYTRRSRALIHISIGRLNFKKYCLSELSTHILNEPARIIGA